MSKQRISNSPRVLEYLLNNEIPISDRLAEYNKHVNLAFEKGLYPIFDKLVFDNEIGIEAFKIEKQKAIDTIQNKQRTLDYESFVRYLFYEIGVFDNKRTIHGTETIIYDITPTDEQQAEILERVSIEYAKANAGTYIKEALKIGSKTLLVPFILFESLKAALQDSLEKPFANKQQVIAYYKKQHLEPLQDTKNESTAQTIYRNFKAGKTIRNKEQDYLYYTTKGAVMELLEFENYLNQTSDLQQTETAKPDEVTKELHNHIFKGNAFEVFEKYHNNKSLAENSRTDLNLLFQLFKIDNLFVETVELKHYIQWLNKTYGYGLTELKKVDINSKPNIQRTNDYKEYKRTTLKQPRNRSNHTAP